MGTPTNGQKGCFMRRHKWVLGLVAAGLGATGLVAPSASAAPAPTAEVISVSKVRLIDGKPFIAGTYRCTGKLSHLWVSAKQGRGDLSQEGSGADARAWWDRTKDNRVKCDGRKHTTLVRLWRRDDSGRLRPEPRGRLAWVQFCLLTANTPEDLGEGGAFASNMHWRHVIRA